MPSNLALPSAGSITTTTLHPGNSKKVGIYTVLCTAGTVARTKTRIVLHPGYQVTVRGDRIRCVRATTPSPTPKPTPAPTPTPTPTPTPQQGTRANPWPVGAQAGDSTWKLKVNSVNFDAWPLIQAANMFNSPPPAGAVDVLASLTVSYVGSSNASLDFDFHINLGTVGASGVVYRSYIQSCGVEPDPNILDFTTLLQGATVTYNECWQVPTSDIPTLALYYDQWANGFFALR